MLTNSAADSRLLRDSLPVTSTAPSTAPSSGSSPGASLLHVTAGSQAAPRRGASTQTDVLRVVLADDHHIVRDGLHLVLRGVPDIAVVGEAADCEEALTITGALKPDVLVLDLRMRGGRGESIIGEVASQSPDTRVLVLTMYSDDERALACMEAGARGFLCKEASASELIEGIRTVARGETFVRPAVDPAEPPAIRTTGRSEQKRAFRQLSGREQSVLRMVAEGFSGVEIAAHLGISTKTVDAYKHRVQEKLGVSHRTDYVKFAIEAGLLGG